MTKATLIEKMAGMGYALTPNTDYHYSRCWGKSYGDMEYVNLENFTYSREYVDPDEENFTEECANFTELAEWILD